MENNNYPQANLDLSEILEYANSEVNNLDKQRILKQQLPLLQSYAKEQDLHSVIKLLKSFPVNIQDEFWREFDRDLDSEMHENLERNKNPGIIDLESQNSKILEIIRPRKRTKRANQLHELIEKVYLTLLESNEPRPSASEVWNELMTNKKKYDVDEIIQEVVKFKAIVWISKDSKEQKMKWSTFKKQLSIIRSK
jgi:Mg/Co/Ni transporter MgtE